MLDVIGQPWLFFTTTASDQLHVDITQTEMIPSLNHTLLLTPAIVAFCANSPIFGGISSGVCSGREYLMQNCQKDLHRHGLPLRLFNVVDDWFNSICELPFLMRPNEMTGLWEKVTPDGISLVEYFKDFGVSWANFLAHEHYVWHSTRPRVKQVGCWIWNNNNVLTKTNH
jgi:hypothetical protein